MGRAAEYRMKAFELRKIAAAAKSDEARRTLEALAREHERLADHAEAEEKGSETD